jgi:hypothetical protein
MPPVEHSMTEEIDPLWTVDFQGKLVFDVQKINKRLHIVLRESDKLIPIRPFGKYLSPRGSTIFYTPPDFIRRKIPSRLELQGLANALNTCKPAKNRIMFVMYWESSIMEGY